MTHDEAMSGHYVSYTQAKREIECHGQMVHGIITRNGKDCIEVSEYGSNITEIVALNSKAVLEWLGY